MQRTTPILDPKVAPKKEKSPSVAVGKAANSMPAEEEDRLALAVPEDDESMEDNPKKPTPKQHEIHQVSVSCFPPHLIDLEIQTHVIRSASLVEESLLQFWNTVGADDRCGNIVAFDVKYSWDQMKITSLVLCSALRCLIIQLGSFRNTPASIKAFMASKHLTFVGFRAHEDVRKLEEGYGILLRKNSVVDISELAGRINSNNGNTAVNGLLDIDTLGRKIKEKLSRGNHGLGKRKKKVAGDLLFKPAPGDGGGLDEEQIGVLASDTYAVFEIAKYYLGHLIK